MTYEVDVEIWGAVTLTVDADSEEEAEEQARWLAESYAQFDVTSVTLIGGEPEAGDAQE